MNRVDESENKSVVFENLLVLWNKTFNTHRPCRKLNGSKDVSRVCTSKVPHCCSVIGSDMSIEEKKAVLKVTAGFEGFRWLYEASFNWSKGLLEHLSFSPTLLTKRSMLSLSNTLAVQSQLTKKAFNIHSVQIVTCRQLCQKPQDTHKQVSTEGLKCLQAVFILSCLLRQNKIYSTIRNLTDSHKIERCIDFCKYIDL